MREAIVVNALRRGVCLEAEGESRLHGQAAHLRPGSGETGRSKELEEGSAQKLMEEVGAGGDGCLK